MIIPYRELMNPLIHYLELCTFVYTRDLASGYWQVAMNDSDKKRIYNPCRFISV